MVNKMKKIVAVFLSVLMILSMFTASLTSFAQTVMVAENELEFGVPLEANKNGVFTFVAPTSDAYVFYSNSQGMADPWAELYDSKDNYLLDDNTYNYDFKIGYYLLEVETYYLIVLHIVPKALFTTKCASLAQHTSRSACVTLS